MKTQIVLTFIVLLLFTTFLVAQPPFPGDPPQAPIDGGLGILAAAGGAYALKKLRDRKNNNMEE